LFFLNRTSAAEIRQKGRIHHDFQKEGGKGQEKLDHSVAGEKREKEWLDDSGGAKRG